MRRTGVIITVQDIINLFTITVTGIGVIFTIKIITKTIGTDSDRIRVDIFLGNLNVNLCTFHELLLLTRNTLWN